MQITVDSTDNMLIIDGVNISLELLAHMVRPNPSTRFWFERGGDVVIVHQYALAYLPCPS
jgi:hypothetical protein